jgi:hypothetical protein
VRFGAYGTYGVDRFPGFGAALEVTVIFRILGNPEKFRAAGITLAAVRVVRDQDRLGNIREVEATQRE